MKSRLALLGLFLGCITILPSLEAQNSSETPAKKEAKVSATASKEDKDKKEPEKIDVTAQARAQNSDQYAAPPTQFRPGHVSAKMLDAKALQKTATGYTIQLPSKAPIPTPTVYKDKLFVSGGFHSKEYYCFNADDGKLVWGMSLDDDGPTSAVCDDDVVVFNTESCTIFALDAKTGKNLWSYFLGDPLTSTPTIAHGKVFTSYPANGGGGNMNQATPDALINQKKPTLPAPAKQPPPAAAKQRPNVSHVLACFELKTGKILWQRWIDSDVMSAPVAVDDELYATTFFGTVYKFKQDDGTILSAQNSRATCAPIVAGGKVYWTQRADKGKGDQPAEEIAGLSRATDVLAFSAAKRPAIYLDRKVQDESEQKKLGAKLDAGNGFAGGAPAAANPTAAYANVGQANVSTMQAFQGSRILNYQDANYNCMGDELLNTDPKDGKLRWKVKLKGDLAKQGGHLAAPPAAAGGQLFLTTLAGEVLQVDPEKGNVTKTYQVGSPIRAQPAIEGGRIYVGTQDGKIVCINTGDPRFTGWATWGANMAHTNIAATMKK